MAVNYTDVFEDVGCLVEAIRRFRNMAVGTPTSLSGAITGATAANPVVVTSTGHGLTTGDRIRIDGVVGMVEINDSDFTVAVLTANTFQLVGEDGSGHTAYTSGGIWVRQVPTPDLPDLLDNIESVLNGNSRHDILSGIPESFEAMQDTAIGWCDELANKAVDRLLHRTTILEELTGLAGRSDLVSVMREIIRDMNNNSQTVNASVVTLGSVTAEGSNTGNGTILLDKTLDGISNPHTDMPSSPEYAGVDSELAVSSEVMSWTVQVDEDTDGISEGHETLLWEGKPGPQSPFDWRTEGSGLSVQVPTLNSYDIISNRNFEAWNSNVPDGWDLDDGTAGTHVVQETTAADVYRGTSCLEIAGDGSEATIQISQTIPIQGMTPKRRYALSCLVKGHASIAAGTLTIQFESASGGYTASSSEKIEMNAAALAAQTSFDRETFYINAPATIPDDMELVIKVTGTLTNSTTVHVDSLAFGPVTWGNGVNCVAIAGSTQFARNDRFTATISNDDGGLFQEFARKRLRMQFPSDTGGSETIADSLAAR